jgi:hypothetical protein
MDRLPTVLLALVVVVFLFLGMVLFLARMTLLWVAARISQRIERQVDQMVGATAGSVAAQQTFGLMKDAGARLRQFAEQRGYDTERAKDEFLRRLDGLARRMDSALTLPVIGGVGLNAVVGLIPVVGDAICAAVGVVIIANSLQYGLPQPLVRKMVANVFTQFVIGIPPIVGDFAVVVYRANTRNIKLLEEHLESERQRLRAGVVRTSAGL